MKPTTPRRIAAIFLVLALLAVSGCRRAEELWPSGGAKRVLVSFPPLYCFTKNIADKDVDVRCLLTAQGPHDFSPRPNDVRLVREADLILINGLGLDEWVVKMLKNGKGNLVEVAEGIPEKLLKPTAEGESHADDGHGHKHGPEDPHVWLGPPQAKAMVDVIAAKLAELDTKNKARYGERAEAYKKELDDLQAYGNAKFGNKKNRNHHCHPRVTPVFRRRFWPQGGRQHSAATGHRGGRQESSRGW